MINPEAVAAGVAVGIAAEQANKFIEHVRGEESQDASIVGLLHQQRDFLRIIAERLSPQLTPALNRSVQLFAYPNEFKVPVYDRAHMSIFFPSGISGTPGAYTPTLTSIKIYIEIPGIGSHTKTLTPGWTQLDLPPDTLLSTADGNSYNAIISFRDDPIGTAI